jgi:hypothetical protein
MQPIEPIVPAIPQAPPIPGFVGIDALLGEQKPQPQGSDLHPLLAGYNVPAFNHELIPGRACEVIVGESVEFVQARPYPGSLWELARAPEGSKAKLSGRRLVPDRAGLYIVACTLPGGWRREINATAFPPEALDLVGYLPTQQLQKRMRLRAIVEDPNATRETIAAGLEDGETDLATLAGYTGKKRGGFRVENYR